MENVWHTQCLGMDFLSKIIIIDTAGLFLGKTCHLPQLSHKMFSVLTTVDFTKSSCTAEYILFEVCFQSWLRSCTASWINSQRQLVQRWTTITEVIVWQKFNTRQLQSHWHKQHYLYICHMQLFSVVIYSIYRQHMLAYLAVTLCWSP